MSKRWKESIPLLNIVKCNGADEYGEYVIVQGKAVDCEGRKAAPTTASEEYLSWIKLFLVGLVDCK